MIVIQGPLPTFAGIRTFVRQTSYTYRCDPSHTAAELSFSAAGDGRLMVDATEHAFLPVALAQ